MYPWQQFREILFQISCGYFSINANSWQCQINYLQKAYST